MLSEATAHPRHAPPEAPGQLGLNVTSHVMLVQGCDESQSDSKRFQSPDPHITIDNRFLESDPAELRISNKDNFNDAVKRAFLSLVARSLQWIDPRFLSGLFPLLSMDHS
jgi:hypothetical protein